ncbi:hypothetical protein HUU05_06760 [candidate division KSB1 bacterium]|nr:hypothetical protein [candidate division KSB1 bacterium]
MTLNQQTSVGPLASDALPTQSLAPSISFRDLVLMVYRRRGLALGLFAGIFLTVAVVTMLMPSVYVARSQVLLKKERVNNVISATESAAADVKPQLTEEVLNSEIEIIKSSYLLREVLRAAELYQRIVIPPEDKQLTEEQLLEVAVLTLKKALECQIVPKSNIIQISYESEDPQLAAQLVNEIGRHYVDRHLQVHESAGVYSFFQNQAEALQDTVRQLSEALQQFEAEHGLIAPDKQRELLLQQLKDYESQWSLARANAETAGKQVAFLEKQLAAAPERMQAQSDQVSQAAYEALVNQLAGLKKRYAQLLEGELKPEDPQGRLAKSLKGRIAQMEEALLRAENAPPPEVTSDINRAVLDLSAELTRTRASLIGYQAQEQELQSGIVLLKERLAILENAKLTHENLLRELELLRNNHLLYAKKQEEARISEALDREKVANVSIVDPASVPIAAVRPNRKLNLALGLVLALLVSLGTTLGLGFFDKQIRSSNDLERQLHLPFIVAIPEGQWPPELLLEESLANDGVPKS